MSCRSIPVQQSAEEIILRHVLYFVALLVGPFDRFRRFRSRFRSWEAVKCRCGWVGMRGPNVNHEFHYCGGEDVVGVELCPACEEEV